MFKLLRKRLFKTTKNKGFTLTELIVVVAVVALLMGCVVAFAGPIRTAVKGSTAKADCLTINDLLSSYIQRKLAYANDVHVFVGHNYSTTGKIKNALLGDGSSGAQCFARYANLTKIDNHPGIMIMHYSEDKNDPLKHTYKLYDYTIPKGLTSMPVESSIINDNNLVYIDEFYGGYEFFMTFDGPAGDPDDAVDMASVANTQTERAYFNMHIDSFNITGDYTNSSFTDKDIIDYFSKYKSDGKFESEMDKYVNERVAVDNVSFNLENIKVDVEYKQVDENGDGKPDVMRAFPTVNSFNIDRGNESGSYDTDIIIFYNVRIYDIKSDDLTAS